MTFKDALKLIFKRDEKPEWYRNIPLRRRFSAWRHTMANPIVVLKCYFRHRRSVNAYKKYGK